MLARRHHGLSAYPTDPYFDPNRPAWLPYWVDTFDENAQKWGLFPGANINQKYPAPPMPTPPGVPLNLPANPLSLPTAQAAVDDVVAQRARQQALDTSAFFANVTAQLDAANAERAKETQNAIRNTMLLMGAVFAGFLVLHRVTS
jgi:hypothetical protein